MTSRHLRKTSWHQVLLQVKEMSRGWGGIFGTRLLQLSLRKSYPAAVKDEVLDMNSAAEGGIG
jgi:hypothetical protein